MEVEGRESQDAPSGRAPRSFVLRTSSVVTGLLAVSSAVATLSSSVASSSSSAESSSARGLRVGHVDTDAATVKVLVVEAGDGGVGLRLGAVGLAERREALDRARVCKEEKVGKNKDERRSRSHGTCQSRGPS